jgi:hypothetical protein
MGLFAASSMPPCLQLDKFKPCTAAPRGHGRVILLVVEVLVTSAELRSGTAYRRLVQAMYPSTYVPVKISPPGLERQNFQRC